MVKGKNLYILVSHKSRTWKRLVEKGFIVSLGLLGFFPAVFYDYFKMVDFQQIFQKKLVKCLGQVFTLICYDASDSTN